MRTGHDQFRLGARKVRTPVRHHAVRTVGCIASAAVADDRMMGRVDGERVQSVKKRILRRKAVNACRHPLKAKVFLKRSGNHGTYPG
jgi:predicted alpha-1,6-mannanase (GH76 family)